MFTVGKNKPRLQADAPLSVAEFRTVAARLGGSIVRARKIGYVAARRVKSERFVETRWNGEETTNIARIGDWLVTNLTPQREVLRDGDGHANTYVITADRFANLYERADGRIGYGNIFRAKNQVEAIAVPGGLDILAPWGERQRVSSGYLLSNGHEVYGCQAEAFAATYEIVSG